MRIPSPRTVRPLVVFLIIAFLPAAVGGLFDPGEWYGALVKPRWTPPAWVFAPVWMVLYMLIGIAGSIAWSQAGAGRRVKPFAVYAAQLLANGLWSYLFFGLHRTGVALLDLAVLWVLVLLNLLVFLPIARTAALLLSPYLLWVTFAAALNYEIYALNL